MQNQSKPKDQKYLSLQKVNKQSFKYAFIEKRVYHLLHEMALLEHSVAWLNDIQILSVKITSDKQNIKVHYYTENFDAEFKTQLNQRVVRIRHLLAKSLNMRLMPSISLIFVSEEFKNQFNAI